MLITRHTVPSNSGSLAILTALLLTELLQAILGSRGYVGLQKLLLVCPPISFCTLRHLLIGAT
jgi:hypothetical protein